MKGRCLAACICVSLLLTACAGENAGAGETVQEMPPEDLFPITRQDQKTEPDSDREQVDLNAYEKNRVILTGSGDIWLSGSLEDGQLIIDADEDELVHLYLEGVRISSSQGPAILVEEASKVIVTLVSGTESVLSDSPEYTGYEESKACLYSVCDLTINGEGSLQVSGYYEDGIRSKDVVRILGSQVEVQAKGDGIRGNDGIVIKDGQIGIQSEENGIRTANQGKGTKGDIEISGGSLSVIAGKNGIYAASDLYLRDCDWEINSVEEKTRAEGSLLQEDGPTAK